MDIDLLYVAFDQEVVQVGEPQVVVSGSQDARSLMGWKKLPSVSKEFFKVDATHGADFGLRVEREGDFVSLYVKFQVGSGVG